MAAFWLSTTAKFRVFKILLARSPFMSFFFFRLVYVYRYYRSMTIFYGNTVLWYYEAIMSITLT